MEKLYFILQNFNAPTINSRTKLVIKRIIVIYNVSYYTESMLDNPCKPIKARCCSHSIENYSLELLEAQTKYSVLRVFLMLGKSAFLKYLNQAYLGSLTNLMSKIEFINWKDDQLFQFC